MAFKFKKGSDFPMCSHNRMMPSTDLLRIAWEQGVKQDYLDGLIQYESNLQAALYYHLRHLSSGERVISIVHKEKSIDYQEPDLLIVNPDGVSIDFVLELKCIPWNSLTYKNYRDDLDKLLKMAKKAQANNLELKPYFNPDKQDLDDKRICLITKETNYAFVAISKGDDIEKLVKGRIEEQPMTNFWILWAKTDEDIENSFKLEPYQS